MRTLFIFIGISLFTCLPIVSQNDLSFDKYSKEVQAKVWNENGIMDYFSDTIGFTYEQIMGLRVLKKEHVKGWVFGIRTDKPPTITTGSKQLRPVTVWPLKSSTGNYITSVHTDYRGKKHTTRLCVKVDCGNLVKVPYDPPTPPPPPEPKPPVIHPIDTTIEYIYVHRYEKTVDSIFVDCVSQELNFRREGNYEVVANYNHHESFTIDHVTVNVITRVIIEEKIITRIKVVPRPREECEIRIIEQTVPVPVIQRVFVRQPVFMGGFPVQGIRFAQGGRRVTYRRVVTHAPVPYYPLYRPTPPPPPGSPGCVLPTRQYSNHYDRFLGAPGTRGNGPSRWPR